MRKYILSLIALTAMLQAPSAAQAGCFDNCCDSCIESPALEVKFAALYPFKSLVREIYNDFLPCVEVEASFKWGETIKPWANVSYIWNNGHSIGGDDKTSIRVLPIAVGADLVFDSCFCNTDLYLGAGATYSWLKIHDESPYVHQHTDEQAWGGLARAGFIYHYCENIFFDGFVEYNYVKFDVKKDSITDPLYTVRNDLDFSNLKFGVGVGYTF